MTEPEKTVPKTNNNMDSSTVQTLRFFCILELVMGIWLLFPNITLKISIFDLQHWVLAIVFICGSILNAYISTKYRRIIIPRYYLTLYIWLTSLPLFALGLLFVQVSIDNQTIAATAILAPACGVYSVIFAAQSFPQIVRQVRNDGP